MRKLGLIIVAAALAAPSPSLAQATTTDTNGVLGLAGLLGRKKNDRDIHVDGRSDTRR
jgi:hypothetical protein